MRNEPQWNSQVSNAELRSDEPIELGSRFSIVNGGKPYDVTITTSNGRHVSCSKRVEACPHDRVHAHADR